MLRDLDVKNIPEIGASDPWSVEAWTGPFHENSENYKQFTEFAEKSEMFAKRLQRYGLNNMQDAQNQIIDSRETRGMEWSISDARKEVYANFV